MYIAPSLLAADFSVLAKEIEKVKTADLLHIDIMDGHFVPNISMGPAVISAIRGKTDLLFDVHLMLQNPIKYIEAFVKAGADIITCHPECDDDFADILAEIERLGVKAGAAVKPATPAEAIYDYADKLYMVTVMTVEPGFGGQQMNPQPLTKIREIKEKFPHIIVEVDGGVNRETVVSCRKAGADVLVAGTAIFAADDPEGEIALLRGC